MIQVIITGVSSVVTAAGTVAALKYFVRKSKLKKLDEINDSPFKFYVNDEDRLLFELCKDVTLWCDYSFGIRSDGIYGINNITLRGINDPYGGIRDLKIGQSVFPMIKAMDEFTTWIDKKPFDTKFKSDFESEWELMKKNLDNLRYLESEEKKKEKKSK